MRKNDYSAFASSFLDLWQEQIARAMSDTDFLQSLMDNMQHMQSGVFSHDAAQQNHKHPAHASEPEPDELSDMQRRLASAERKITKLEAALERLAERDEAPRAKPKPAPTVQPKPIAKRTKPAAAKAPAKPQQKPKPKAPAAKAKPKATAKPALRKRAVKRR